MKINLAVAVLVASLLTTCEKKSQTVVQSDLSTEIAKNGIDSGIIGKLDFIEIPTGEYPEVNMIQVINQKKRMVQSQGSGTRLRDHIHRRDYILTVAHIFNYESNDCKLRDCVLYVGKNGNFNNGDWFEISPKLYATINPRKKDVILIPINYDETASAYDINNYSAKGSAILPAGITIVSMLNLKNAEKLRKVKQSAKLLGKFKLRNPLWKTDADLFLGMSGSPVFNEKQQIIGVVSRITKTKDCKEYSNLSCHNLIAPVEQDWMKEWSQQVFRAKLFDRIDNKSVTD